MRQRRSRAGEEGGEGWANAPACVRGDHRPNADDAHGADGDAEVVVDVLQVGDLADVAKDAIDALGRRERGEGRPGAVDVLAPVGPELGRAARDASRPPEREHRHGDRVRDAREGVGWATRADGVEQALAGRNGVQQALAASA